MEWKNCLPQMILDFISDSNTKEIDIGCSDSHVIKIEKENKNYYLKILKENFLLSEYRRLNWLAEKLSVPKVTMFVQENHYDYLITEEMPGQMLCEDYYLHHPKVALDILKEAFQKLISVDISDCPFDVSNSYKLELVKKNIEKGLVKDDTLKKETREKFGTARQVLKYLEDNAKTNINTKMIYEASLLVSSITGSYVQHNKPIVGANAFKHEAGIHQAGVLKNKKTYEIMDPKRYGIYVDNMVIGVHSGKHVIIDKMKKLGFDPDNYDVESITFDIKEFFKTSKTIEDSDIISIINNNKIKKNTKRLD